MFGNKYHSRKTTIDGITFDSRKEANYYCQLRMLLKGKVIKGFRRQVKFELQEGYTRNGEKVRPIYYVADFVVEYKDRVEVVDVKGMRTDVYKLKKKLLLKKYPEMIFVEV
ncbi:MAG: DUF1064 domain-containing protein [Phascolarctobacterium sp.]|nr:DUF1064 domain-containing protein [Candidatus Phascolarctobacterium caballi]